MIITIVGAGNSGCANAFVAAEAGHEVRILKTTKGIGHDEHFDTMRENGGLWGIDNTLSESPLRVTATKRLISADRIATGLVQASVDYDLIALGASKEGVFSSVLFGEIPEKVARYSKTSVMIVKRYEGVVKTVVKKILG